MENTELKAGITGKTEMTVSESDTASAYGSGMLPVFATPAMIALMEKTAMISVGPYLADGNGTVGTLLNVKHTSATPVGMKVTCESVLTEIDGRRLVFGVKAYDEAGIIGEGTHERFIITNEKFLAKTVAKSKS